MIGDYSEICVPKEIKHMKTTWLTWAHQLNEKQFIKYECAINDISGPKVNIVKLDENNGSIVIKFQYMNKMIILYPYISCVLSDTFEQITDFFGKDDMEIGNCLINLRLKVKQIEDFDFKLLDCALHFRDEINEKIEKIPGEIDKNSYCQKMEIEHADLIRLMSDKEFKFGSSSSKMWLSLFSRNELNTIVINHDHFFSIMFNSFCYIKIGYKNMKFKNFLRELWFQFHRTKFSSHIQVPFYYLLHMESFKGKLYFDGIGWNFYLKSLRDMET